MSGYKLEHKLGRLLILETTRLEDPNLLTLEDWKEYRHLRNEYETLFKTARERKKITYRELRRYLESGVI